MIPIATFSIAAYDPNREEWGVAVQSKFLACGAVVPWARAGVGAVATQSYANVRYGVDGLDMMAEGMSAEETIVALTEPDEHRALRQVGLVDKNGRAAAFTGEACHEWAGHIVGEHYTCQGNILVPGTVAAIAEAYEQARQGSGELVDWLVTALAAGQAAGGDKRGRQAAGVLVVRENGGYGGNHDRYIDLRVDDHPTPIQKLQDLVAMHHLYFGEVDASNLLSLADIAGDLQVLLQRTGHYRAALTGQFDEKTQQALWALVSSENLEERWDGTEDMIDGVVVDYLMKRFGEDTHDDLA